MTKISLLTLLATTGGLSAQGLLGILPTLQEVETKPFYYGVGVNVGYDTNVNTTETNQTESAYLGGNLSAGYRHTTERTTLSLGLKGGANYYFDQAEGADDTLYNAGLSMSLTHSVSDRLNLSNDFYLGYDYDPNFVTGASLNRSNNEYLNGYDRLSLNYSWTDRLSTTTGFNIGGTFYDDTSIDGSPNVGETEDRMEYGANQLVRYALSEQLGLRAEYRFNYTDYDSGLASTSHILMVGADYQISENTIMVGMVGAELYDSDLSGENTKPYAELGITHQVAEGLSIAWVNRLGYEATGVGVYDSNYTFRSNLDVRYQWTQKLSSYAGVTYLYTDYEGEVGNTENLIEGRVGLNYALTEVIGLGLNYTYTDLSSDIDGESYDRQRINLGINASF